MRSIIVEQFMVERNIPFDNAEIAPNATHLLPMKRILIVSTWRSGSSFLGEVIHSAPGVFYSYEPLHFFDYGHPAGPYSKTELIQSIFNCSFPGDYLRHINKWPEGEKHIFMRKNRRVWEACQREKSLCYRPDFVGQLCTYFPIQLIKVVRLRAKELTPLLEDISKDWKIVYLARDPRGVMASRANLTWCQLDPACSDVRRLCADVQEDFELIERLKI